MSFWSGKRVLVTGATGMVGSWLTSRLVSEGARVVVLVRDADPQSELFRSGTIHHTNVVAGRLEDLEAVERAITVHEADTLFHLGAQTIVGTALRSPMRTFESNIQGTWHVLEVARLHRDLVRRVVVASSDKAYGDKEILPYTEDMSLAGSAPYEVSKSCTDLITQSYAKTYGVPVAIARCGNIYGGGDLNWSRIVPGTLRSLAFGEQPIIRSDGSFLRDYVYVKDVVDAYLTLGESLGVRVPPGEAFNFSEDSPMTVLQMYEEVCRSFGRPRTTPSILGLANHEIKHQYLSSAKAREQLGWSVSFGLERGLKETVNWYQEFFASRTSEPLP